MAFKISADVPQALIDEFNKVDFKKVNTLMRHTILAALKSYANSNLVKKDPNKKYSKKAGDPPKKIAKDFDQKLLDLMNEYDWGLCSQALLQNMIYQVRGYMGSLLPVKA